MGKAQYLSFAVSLGALVFISRINVVRISFNRVSEIGICWARSRNPARVVGSIDVINFGEDVKRQVSEF